MKNIQCDFHEYIPDNQKRNKLHDLNVQIQVFVIHTKHLMTFQIGIFLKNSGYISHTPGRIGFHERKGHQEMAVASLV